MIVQLDQPSDGSAAEAASQTGFSVMIVVPYLHIEQPSYDRPSLSAAMTAHDSIEPGSHPTVRSTETGIDHSLYIG
jgi:hypothetical protein